MSRLDVERILLERARLYFPDVQTYDEMAKRFDTDSLATALTDEHGELRLIDDVTLRKYFDLASRSRMVQATLIPCPDWCTVRDSQDGEHHGFSPTTAGGLIRDHLQILGEGLTSVTIVLTEHAATVEGPTLIANDAADSDLGGVGVIYADVDDMHINPLTGPAARALAATLLRAAEAWDELQTLASS